MMRAYAVILPTFFVAMVLAIFPMPRLLDYVRPEWVAMTLIFWVLLSPSKAGVFLGLCMGLLLDVMHGQLLGLNGLALSVLAYLVMLLQSRMRLYNPVQQSLLVFVLVGLYLLVTYKQWCVGVRAWGHMLGLNNPSGEVSGDAEN